MAQGTTIRVITTRLIKATILLAFVLFILPNTTGCLAYQIYSGIKTAEKVKDFTEDHILKNDDDDDKDKDKHNND